MDLLYLVIMKCGQHVHLSDNVSPNGDINAYARFRLRSEFEGLTPHVNETYSREEFEDFQQSCALRGVTVSSLYFYFLYCRWIGGSLKFDEDNSRIRSCESDNVT